MLFLHTCLYACAYSLNICVSKSNTLPAIMNLNCTYTCSANNEHCCEWSDCRIDPSVTIIPLLVTTQVLDPTSLTLFGNYHELHAYCPSRTKPAPAYIMNSNVKHNPTCMDSQVPIYLPAVRHDSNSLTSPNHDSVAPTYVLTLLVTHELRRST